MSLIETVSTYLDAGLSVIPVQPGTKKPPTGFGWTKFQSMQMSDREAVAAFSGDKWLAILGGDVSGSLEIIDFDVDETGKAPHFGEWWKQVAEYLGEDFRKTLVVSKTPSGGFHVYYRCPGHIKGNLKLARTSKEKCIIETRGVGGYVVAAPSDGYEFKQGDPTKVPTITEYERGVLIGISEGFGTYEDPVLMPKKQSTGSNEVFDKFNRDNPIGPMLEKAGWRYVGKLGRRDAYCRPGKEGKHVSGTVSFYSVEIFQNFSTSTVFPIEKGMDACGVHAWLNYNGDFSAFGKAIEPKYREPKSVQSIVDAFNVHRVETDTEKRWESVNCDDYDENEMPMYGIFGHYLLRKHLNLFSGRGGGGKSTVLMAIAAWGSTGSSWFTGHEIEPFRTLYFATEDEGAAIKRKLLFFKGDPKMIDIVEVPVDLSQKENLDFLYSELKKKDYKLWILDPAIAYAWRGFSDNSRGDVSEFTTPLKQIARATESCGIVVLHERKGGLMVDKSERYAGSAAWVDYCRSHLSLTKLRDARVVTHEKGNIDNGPDRSFGFEYTSTGFNWALPGMVDYEVFVESKGEKFI